MSKDWKSVLVSPTITIQESLKVIDSEALKIALVVDENNNLLGTVTDGDIRRAIIKGNSLDTPVANVMYRSPTTAQFGTSRDELLEIMKAKKLLAIPLMQSGKIVGLELLESASVRENPVFLMAGGFGTRLRPLTDNCPKPLLEVGNKPILEITLLNFIKYGFKNFYISTHYLPDMIKQHFGDGSKWNVNITYVYESEPLGTGGALGLLPKNIPSLPMIVMNGDILTNINYGRLIDFHTSQNADATMCVREYEYKIPYGVVESEDGKIVSMVEKPTKYFNINAGIYVLNNDLINNVSSNQKIDMPTLLTNKISQEAKVMTFPIHDYWLDIGQMDDYHRAQTDIINIEF